MIRVGRRDWKAVEPLPLNNSWPLFELSRHFELGLILNSEAIAAVQPDKVGALSSHHAGCWECNLADNGLTWSGGVYDIFGLPRNAKVARQECLAFYSESSRIAMERLRSHAIRHRVGFTLDAEIHSAVGETRWMRLIGAPVCENDRVVRLQGLKLIIS